MTADDAADLVRQALTCVMILAAPAILIALACGLLISLLQAVTSLQDQTISTVPKLVITMGVILVTLPWTVRHVTYYSRQVLENASSYALPEPDESRRLGATSEPIRLAGDS